MATYQHNFQLGILPERKIDRRALAASYAFVVLLAFLLVNMGILFPDRMSSSTYRVTSMIPLPALKPEPAPVKVAKPVVKPKLLPPAPVFEKAEIDCAARSASRTSS